MLLLQILNTIIKHFIQLSFFFLLLNQQHCRLFFYRLLTYFFCHFPLLLDLQSFFVAQVAVRIYLLDHAPDDTADCGGAGLDIVHNFFEFGEVKLFLWVVILACKLDFLSFSFSLGFLVFMLSLLNHFSLFAGIAHHCLLSSLLLALFSTLSCSLCSFLFLFFLRLEVELALLHFFSLLFLQVL